MKLNTTVITIDYLILVIQLYIWHHSGLWSDFSYWGHSKNFWTELNWTVQCSTYTSYYHQRIIT